MNMCSRWLFTALLSMALPTQAANLGVVGQVFPISEIDMLQWIQQRLKRFEQTGELDSMREQFQSNVKEGVRRPRPVGLLPTTTPEVFSVDPSLTLASDITDIDGNVIYPKGTRINPFDTKTWPAMQQAGMATFTFSKTLILLDGDDVQQLNWAREYQAKHSDQSIKWILTGGEPETIHHQLNERIYFDQQGNISRKLTIKRVPSVVKQVGIKWQVTEIDVSHFSLTPTGQRDETQ